MKKAFLIFQLCLFSSMAYGQTWFTSMDSARATAEQKKLPIVLVFQGSDWCAPCIRLDKQIWSTDTFQSYASEHYVMLKADFPRKSKNALPKDQQKANEMLAEQYNQEGYFPLVVILNEKGEMLGKAGYENVTPEEYIKLINALIL